jgi:hypothetical protein
MREHAGGDEMNAAVVNESLSGKETSTIHTFERAGLGKAPFYFTGTMTEKVHCVPGGIPRAGSSCDYCGTGIRYEFWVESSDSKTFKVGCDCIRKTGDAGLIKQISAAERKLRDVKNAAARVRKAERIAARVEAAMSLLPTIVARLSEKPHPTPYFASEGRTLLDYVKWCLENRAGEKAASIIESEAAA